MGDRSFPRESRLRKSLEFRRVTGEGRKLHTRNLLVFFSKSPTGSSRLGVTVTRKFGKAVQRNRAKRVLREAFRLNRDALPSGMDVVLLVKRESGHPTLALYEKDLLHACRRYGRN